VRDDNELQRQDKASHGCCGFTCIFRCDPGRARRGEARIKALAKSKERPTLKIEGRGTRNGHDNYKDKGNHDGNCDDGGILRCARMTANVYGNVYVNVYQSGYG
jgi:hypothetical protein